ncbi:hypothetical protein B0H14DRAFT_3540464 [Mycena olivaceomarginata]|nr:hypothetical protein B0H14DRAFT_3540464 [Mycena olivaceomarginata]
MSKLRRPSPYLDALFSPFHILSGWNSGTPASESPKSFEERHRRDEWNENTCALVAARAPLLSHRDPRRCMAKSTLCDHVSWRGGGAVPASRLLPHLASDVQPQAIAPADSVFVCPRACAATSRWCSTPTPRLSCHSRLRACLLRGCTAVDHVALTLRSQPRARLPRTTSVDTKHAVACLASSEYEWIAPSGPAARRERGAPSGLSAHRDASRCRCARGAGRPRHRRAPAPARLPTPKCPLTSLAWRAHGASTSHACRLVLGVIHRYEREVRGWPPTPPLPALPSGGAIFAHAKHLAPTLRTGDN